MTQPTVSKHCVAMAGSSDDSAVRYVLPVLWMTSCFHTVEQIQIKDWSVRVGELFTVTRQVAGAGGEICCRRLPCFD